MSTMFSFNIFADGDITSKKQLKYFVSMLSDESLKYMNDVLQNERETRVKDALKKLELFQDSTKIIKAETTEFQRENVSFESALDTELKAKREDYPDETYDKDSSSVHSPNFLRKKLDEELDIFHKRSQELWKCYDKGMTTQEGFALNDIAIFKHS